MQQSCFYVKKSFVQLDQRLTDFSFQVDLGKVLKVTGVATQGADGLTEWVRSYKLEYSVDGSSWTYYPKVRSDTP